MLSKQTLALGWCSLVAVAALQVIGDDAAPPAEATQIAAAKIAVSSFAAADDLTAQVQAYLTSLAEPLADRAAWDEAKQARVEKQAHMLAALVMVLAMHDQPHPLKSAGPALLNAAQALASAGADYDGAVKALTDAKTAAEGVPDGSADGAAPGDGKLQWHQVADCDPLMKQAHVMEIAIKRGLSDPRRFKARAAEVAGHAVALAAMSQSLAFDPAYIGDEQEEQAWLAYCEQSRNAAAELAQAAKSLDIEQANSAYQKMSQSCEACHDQFR